jgi:hypothetical protein
VYVDFSDSDAERTPHGPAYVLGDAVFTYRGLGDASLLAELPRTPTGKLLRHVVQEQCPTLVAVD